MTLLSNSMASVSTFLPAALISHVSLSWQVTGLKRPVPPLLRETPITRVCCRMCNIKLNILNFLFDANEMSVAASMCLFLLLRMTRVVLILGTVMLALSHKCGCIMPFSHAAKNPELLPLLIFLRVYGLKFKAITRRNWNVNVCRKKHICLTW